MSLQKQVLLLAIPMLLAFTVQRTADAEAVSADRVFINQSTIANSGFVVEVEGSSSDVDLFYNVAAPAEFQGRKFKSYLVEVQFEDEIVTTETRSGEVDGCHRISLSLSNVDDRKQRVSLQVVYQSSEQRVLIVYIDLESFSVNGSRNSAQHLTEVDKE